MRIQIRARNVEVTALLRAHVERRLGFALSRFGKRIDRVVVRFSDTTGHWGGANKRCQIDVGMQESVRIEEMDSDIIAAVDRAADRASRSVARALERERELERQHAL